MKNNDPFTFEISLSVLNHLGRNLYRSFMTVLGEAISNAWDADATDVWIYVDAVNDNFVIKDNGIGMSHDDFQNRFLKIGYSKRKDGITSPERHRPYIGRKGIGKLALLSCADRITVISRTEGADYVGGVIDNSGLNDAITEDLSPQQFPLGEWQDETFADYVANHKRGTIIHFDGLNGGIKNTLDYLKYMLALYFRFSLIDPSFTIHVDDDKITLDHLKELAGKTEFLWNINGLVDPYVDQKLINVKETKQVSVKHPMTGFIASVEKPSNLKIRSTDARVGVDLFVNGRLRERDILRHIPTARLPENYFYGQLHFDVLDDGVDRFTSGRESVVSDDPMYRDFLNNLKTIILKCVDDWDELRLDYKKDGDPDNKRITAKQRKAGELFNAAAKDYSLPKDIAGQKVVKSWVADLSDDAAYNFSSYADAFLSENLIRTYIRAKKLTLSEEAKVASTDYKNREANSKQVGNISIEIRQTGDDLSYLTMAALANMVDKAKDRLKDPGLSRDAYEYKPVRDALMHTARLTDEAKQKLNSVYDNIKGRLITMLSNKKAASKGG